MSRWASLNMGIGRFAGIPFLLGRVGCAYSLPLEIRIFLHIAATGRCVPVRLSAESRDREFCACENAFSMYIKSCISIVSGWRVNLCSILHVYACRHTVRELCHDTSLHGAPMPVGIRPRDWCAYACRHTAARLARLCLSAYGRAGGGHADHISQRYQQLFCEHRGGS